MKTITCDKCGKEVGKLYRSVSAENLVIDIGYITDSLYRTYPEYDLCEQCNADFNAYISKKIWEFFQPKVDKPKVDKPKVIDADACNTCKYHGNIDGFFPCDGCEPFRKSDGTIIRTLWESKDEN